MLFEQPSRGCNGSLFFPAHRCDPSHERAYAWEVRALCVRYADGKESWELVVVASPMDRRCSILDQRKSQGWTKLRVYTKLRKRCRGSANAGEGTSHHDDKRCSRFGTAAPLVGPCGRLPVP